MLGIRHLFINVKKGTHFPKKNSPYSHCPIIKLRKSLYQTDKILKKYLGDIFSFEIQIKIMLALGNIQQGIMMNTKKKIEILVIDDNLDMLQWFELLNNSTSPYHFHILQNELNITRTLDKLKPDLIFLDVALNSLDGPLVASIIGGTENGNIPIVYISADKKNGNIILNDDFLLKPFSKEMIFNKIKEKLS